MNEENISNEEIIFLKFISGKSDNIEFSSRWKFQYNINPNTEIEKLLKLKYISYDNNYILTEKAIKILNENKKLFITDKEKAGEEFKELTNTEYTQLKVFHKIKEYKKLKNNELSSENGYDKNDILWTIYNEQKDIYIRKKDYVMASVVYNCMYELLKKEKKYDQALEFMICCLYLRVYDNYLYERHLKKFMKELKDILKKNDIDVNIYANRYDFIINQIKIPIQKYLSYLYNEEKVNIFQQKINQFLSTK